MRLFSLLAISLLGVALSAQTPGLLSNLEKRADEVVTVTLDGPTLRALEPIIRRSEPEDAELFQLLRNVDSVAVRAFTFRDGSAPSDQEIELVRSQLVPAGWSKFLATQKREPAERVEGWAGAGGLALIVTEPGELTGVRVDGPFPASQAPALGRHFGLPSIERQKLELPPDAISPGCRAGTRHAEKLNFGRLVRELETRGVQKQHIPMLWMASPAAFIASGGKARGTHLAIFENSPQGFVDVVEQSLPEGWTRLVDVREHNQQTTIFLGEVGSRLHLLIATGDSGDNVLLTTKIKASAIDQEPTLWVSVGHKE